MNLDPEDMSDAIEPGSESQPAPDLGDSPRKRKRKFNRAKPLDSPEDEAIAQYLATPRSVREFKSFGELARHFSISRMTGYRRTKDVSVLQRVEWLLTQHKLAGDLIAQLNCGRIVAGQVKAAVAGDTKAAQFCKERAWPEPSFFLK